MKNKIRKRHIETSKIIFFINEVIGTAILIFIMYGWLHSELRTDASQMLTADISFMGFNYAVYGVKALCENCHKNPKGTTYNHSQKLDDIVGKVNTISNIVSGLTSNDVSTTMQSINADTSIEGSDKATENCSTITQNAITTENTVTVG